MKNVNSKKTNSVKNSKRIGGKNMNTMRKIKGIIIASLIISVLGCLGCGQTNNDNASSLNPNDSSATTATISTASLNNSTSIEPVTDNAASNADTENTQNNNSTSVEEESEVPSDTLSDNSSSDSSSDISYVEPESSDDYIVENVYNDSGNTNSESNNSESNESEPSTETPTEYYEKDIIIREYGSYAAYEKAFIEAINRIRVENGNAPLIENTYMDQTSEVLADYCISVHKIGHFGSDDSPVFDNLRRGIESVGSFSKRKVIDADQMAWELTTDHTYQIVTEPEMKYIGVSVKNFNGQNAVLVINAISEESYQNTVIGPYPYTEITHGEMHTYHSRFCPQELWK